MSYPVIYAYAGSTVYIPFASYAGSTGASATLSGLAVTDIEVYKNGSATQRASDNGYALLDTDGIDFDSTTGIHGFSIDLSDNSDSGFYAAGNWYWVVVASVTVDSQTVNFVAALIYILPLTRGLTGTALPDAAADAAGGLPISDAGGLDLDAQVGTKINDILADTAEIGAAGAGLTEAGGTGDHLTAVPWNAAWDAEVQSEATDALNAYDPPTRAEATSDKGEILTVLGTPTDTDLATDVANLHDDVGEVLTDTGTTLDDFVDDLESRLTAALATVLQAHSLGIGRGVVDASSTTTAVIFKSVNGAAASSTNDFYNGRHIVFTSGTLTLQACSIEDYDGATVTATVSALTGAPAEDVTFIIV